MNIAYYDADDHKPDVYDTDLNARRSINGDMGEIVRLERENAEYRLLLREFVSGNNWLSGDPGLWYCSHCDADTVKRVAEFVHEPTCPVVRGRKLLAGE